MDQVPTPSSVLRTYFRAKDENRPGLLRWVFASDAHLRIVNRSAAIDFPANTTGRDEIARVLVSDFARTFEDVYSFYMDQPTGEAASFSCDWLVAMTAKEDKTLRVGCGRYDWAFDARGLGLATGLEVTIEAMQVLPAMVAPGVYDWTGQLAYPWSSPAAALTAAPDIPALAPMLRYLASGSEAQEGAIRRGG